MAKEKSPEKAGQLKKRETLFGSKGTKFNSIPTHCLYFSPEVNTPQIDELCDPAERVAMGGYVPSVTGTKAEIERVYRKLVKNPSLVEKYLKTIA